MQENTGIILRGLVAWWLGGLVWEKMQRWGTWQMELCHRYRWL